MERAFLFIDGSNGYHALRRLGIGTGELDYPTLAKRLILNRELVGIRYHVGKVQGDIRRIADQGKFLDGMRAQGVQVSLGRVEPRKLPPDRNRLVNRLRTVIEDHRAELSDSVLGALQELCTTTLTYYVEKRVDVSIAVDMVTMAAAQEFDVAYLLSADGDYVPAVESIRSQGKKVFAAFPDSGAELQKAVNTFIPLKQDWFHGLRI